MRLPARADLAGSAPEDLLALYASLIDELIDQGVGLSVVTTELSSFRAPAPTG
jgi:hypothetical protein